MAVPAWQTDDLADEWPSVSMSLDGNDDEDHSRITGDSDSDSGVEWPTAEDERDEGEMSFTASHGTPSQRQPNPLSHSTFHTRTTGTFVDREPVGTFIDRGTTNVGTFVVHEGAGGVGKTPGKAMIQRDFFTPLKLEKMFEPPSPPKPQADRRYLTPIPQTNTNISPPPSGQFTFQFAPPPAESTPLPHLRAPDADQDPSPNPPAHRPTPGHSRKPSQARTSMVPATPQNKHLTNAKAAGGGTPLKLFQFTYDTYTREHLSALVDSIAVGPGTASSSGAPLETQQANVKPPRRLARRKARNSGGSSRSAHSITPETPVLRSAKRVKLSPISDFQNSEGIEVRITRPQSRRWSGEGRKMMESLKRVDWSTVSSRRTTIGEGQDSRDEIDAPQATPISEENSDEDGSRERGGGRRYANLRNEAASLMAAIKKRVFSGGSDVEASYYHEPRTPESEDDSQESNPEPSVEIPTAPNPNGAFLRVPSTTSTTTLASSAPSRTFSATSQASATTQTTQTSQGQAVQSVGSYTKHPGPAVMRTIRPCDVDVEQLLTATGRMGDMVFDRGRGRWVSINANDADAGDVSGFTFSDESEEQEASQRDQSPARATEEQAPLEPPPEGADTGQELDISHEMDDPWSPSFVSETEDDEVVEEREPPTSRSPSPLTDGDDELTQTPLRPVPEQASSQHFSDSVSSSSSAQSGQMAPPAQTQVTPSPSSVLEPQKTPSRSVLKTPSQVQSYQRHRSRRSVSFSDGRREGPIRGLDLGDSVTTATDSALGDEYAGDGEGEWEKIQDRHDEQENDGEIDDVGVVREGGREMLSVRSRRIEMLLHDQEEEDGFEMNFGVGISSSSASVKGHRRTDTVALDKSSASVKSSVSRSGISVMSAMPSFVLSHDALLGALTDVEPFTAYWDRLVAVDLSWPFTNRRVDASSASFSQGNADANPDISTISAASPTKAAVSTRPPLSSLARLDEFVPRLIKLDLSRNAVEYLTGVPSGIKELIARETLLGSTDGSGGVNSGVGASWGKLRGLEKLDLEGGRVRSVQQLSSLTHLTHLNLASNKITSIRGLENLRRLVFVDLRGNRIRQADFTNCEWGKLEEIRLGGNGMRTCAGLWRIFETKGLSNLTTLDLDDNELSDLEFDAPPPTLTSAKSKLRILRASGNRLTRLDVSTLACLRTLYADRNRLGEVLLPGGAACKVEVVSLRYQESAPASSSSASKGASSSKTGKTKGLRLPTPARDAKRVYLSGTLKPPALARGVKCYALTYLEVAGCGLVAADLDGLASLLPNVRTLNVNYNHFEDGLGFLKGLERVRKVSAVGCGVRRVRGIISVFGAQHDEESIESKFPELQVLDVRGNPCVAGWYLPLTSVTDNAEGIGSSASFTELDIPYRRSLPNKAYAGRLAYRGLVMGGCPSLRVLDGVVVTRKEREKAAELVKRLGAGEAG